MNKLIQHQQNTFLFVLFITIFVSQHPSTRPNLVQSTTFAYAQDTEQCSNGDQTCTTKFKCQIETHDNCSKREIEYLSKMKSKSSEKRKDHIDSLKEFLTRDDTKMDPSLIPWIQDRLHILYSLEGIDSSADEDGTTVISQSSTDADSSEEGKRLISHDELARHTTEEKHIWLSILGKVYDVTNGISFYGPDTGSYQFYAGRDASPCFSSGINNPKGAAEALEEWEGKKLMSVLEWSQFYENHETYKYLGVLVGSKYYNEEGEETEARKLILEKAGEAKAQADKEKEERKKARLEKKKKLLEEKKKQKQK